MAREEKNRTDIFDHRVHEYGLGFWRGSGLDRNSGAFFVFAGWALRAAVLAVEKQVKEAGIAKALFPACY